MTEYDAPHRTETQRLGDDIAGAMRNLRRDWDEMLPKGGAQVAPGWEMASGVHLDDHDPREVDMRRIDRIVSLRRYVVDVLNGWCRVICEDRGTTGHLPDGRDAQALATFLERHSDWMSGHEAASDCRDEVVELAKRCHLVANPPRKETMSIGRCPLEVPGEADVLEVCGGDVRARLATNEHADALWASCNRCGEVSPSDWWAERMFVDGEGSPLVTTGELIAVIAYRLKLVVTHEQVRQWKHRGKIAAAGVDDKGRTLYRHEQVVDSIRGEARAKALRVIA